MSLAVSQTHAELQTQYLALLEKLAAASSIPNTSARRDALAQIELHTVIWLRVELPADIRAGYEQVQRSAARRKADAIAKLEREPLPFEV